MALSLCKKVHSLAMFHLQGTSWTSSCCTYLSVLLTSNHGHYGLRSNDVLHLLVPYVKTELGKKAFVFAAPSAWNLLQKSLKLTTVISYRQFVSTLKNVEQVNIGQCNCS